MGSAALAQERRGARQPLKLMVSLEMLAFTSERQRYPIPGMERVYGNRGGFIALVANTCAGLLLSGLARAMEPHVPTKVPPVPNGGRAISDVRLSDHSPFWDAGTKALMVKDTSVATESALRTDGGHAEDAGSGLLCGGGGEAERGLGGRCDGCCMASERRSMQPAHRSKPWD